MWFKRKPKNRRLGREYVLDVKLRSSQVRKARLRLAALALGVVFAAVLGFYLVYRAGEMGLSSLVYENPAFAIDQIDVQTDGVISTEQLRQWAGVRIGQNLLALDLGRVKRDLEMVPAIQMASVERILPRTLRLRITEREPLAQINLPKPRLSGGVEMVVFHVDAAGWIMTPLEPRQRAADSGPPPDSLPTITGVNPNEVQAGRRLATPQVRAALQLITTFEHSPMAGWVDLKSIDVAAAEVLVATTSQGSEVTFGLAGLEQQLLRWREIFDLGQRNNKAIATLDLAISNNIPARWLEASAVPAPAPKVPKTLRTKKKNV